MRQSFLYRFWTAHPLVFFLSLFTLSSFGQKPDTTLLPWVDRIDFKAKLEPKNQVLTGIGQARKRDFDDYLTVFGPRLKPVIYMDYVGLDQIGRLEKLIQVWESYPFGVIPQLGLAMTHDGKPELRYEHKVVEGLFDNQLDTLCQLLTKWNKPIYIRLGYEFNGFWNGYKAPDFVEAWKKVASKIRKIDSKNQIALVWCFAVDGDNDDFMKFYPGDEWVDWWSIDVFGMWHFERPETRDFLQNALSHKKPVMIGESTPRRMPVQKGEEAWRRWFIPYFNMIRQNPHIKAFCYINWNWTGTPWGDWGNGLLGENPIIKNNWETEIKQSQYAKSENPIQLRNLIRVKP